MTGVTHKNSSGATLSYYNDSFDNADRVTGETWASGTLSGAWTYTYDSTGQLTSDGTHTWSYDLNGNRLGSTFLSENRLSSDGTWTYTYDQEGNLTQKTSGATTWTYGFDNANRMTSVLETVSSTTQVQVTYTYDIFNNRVQESEYVNGTGTTVTRHAYDGQNVWADLNTGNTVLTRYVYGDGVDHILARDVASGQPNAGVAFYLTDRLGSVRDIENSSQVIQDNLNYDGFGNVTESNSGVGDRYKYTAREFDTNTGLQYNRARYYDPSTGRWTSEDPLAFEAGDSNLYRYLGNGPTDWTDPFGLARKINEKDLENAFDELYKKMEDGQISPEEVKLRMTILDNIITGKTRFPKTSDQQSRPRRSWEKNRKGFWVPKKGMGIKAIFDLWTSPNAIQCNKYSKLIIIKSYIDLLCDRFDCAGLERLHDALEGKEIPKELRIKGSKEQGVNLIVKLEERKKGPGFKASELLPGDQIWFENPYYDYLTADEKDRDFLGEEGSNVFYLGNGLVIRIYPPHGVYTIEQYQQYMIKDDKSVDYVIKNKEPLPKDLQTAKPANFQIRKRYVPRLNPF
jgi:RHS repeat-associated protein